MKDTLPSAVLEPIAGYLRTVGRRAHRSWAVNHAHEDSLTGAAFADLHTHRTRRVVVDSREWLWRVRARKFGSGGKASEERRTGADGIVELEVRYLPTGVVEQKGLLIQAKKEWSGADARLEEQVERMEGLAPGCSAAISYSPRGYVAADGRAVLVAVGNRRLVSDSQVVPLGDFLADRFLPCESGLRGLHYDARRQLLHLPAQPARPNAIAFFIPERLRIEIEALGSGSQE